MLFLKFQENLIMTAFRSGNRDLVGLARLELKPSTSYSEVRHSITCADHVTYSYMSLNDNLQEQQLHRFQSLYEF